MKKRIVIAGGGFAGLRTARLLARGLKGTADITLVDRNERFLFTPWLIDGLAGSLNVDDVTEPYEAIAKRDGFTFVRGEILDANRNGNVLGIRLPDGINQAIPFDSLVVAPGAHIAYYDIPGAESATHPLKTVEDLARIHQSLKRLVDRARTVEEAQRAELLHIVVVGGGPAGVEALFAIRRYLEEILSGAPHLEKHLRFTLLNAAPDILSGFLPSIITGSHKVIERQDVELLNGDPATHIEPGVITTKSGKTIKTGFILWCAGVQPNDVHIKPDVPRDAKRCPLPDEALRLAPDIFGGGDAVMCIFEGHPLARSAQVAMMQAEYLAENVILALQGKEPIKYNGKIRGSIIVLGNTGYIQIHSFAIRTPLAIPFRRIFYRFRFWQMTGR